MRQATALAELCAYSSECGHGVRRRGRTERYFQAVFATLVGKVIEERPQSMQLTQADMAEVLEIGQSAYSHLEASQAVMTLPQLRKLAQALRAGTAYDPV